MLQHNLGIMGGTFDPIHNGHIAMAEHCQKAFSLERVLFIPTGNPPHKQNRASDKMHRLEMTRLAVEKTEGFEVSDIEVNRNGMTYAFDTLHQLKDEYPEWNLYYIIGADTLEDLYSWYRIEDVARLTKFLVVGRNGITSDQLHTAALRAREDFGAHLIDAQYTGPDVSSTVIRSLASEGRSLKGYVPDKVEAYIYLHELYKR